MTSALDLTVPLEVDLAAGPNWLDVRPIELDGSPARDGENRGDDRQIRVAVGRWDGV